MGAVYFYHLTRRPLEQTLPVLLKKARQAGWRIAVRGTDPARMDQLDKNLWLGPEDEFLPHGCAGGDHDTAQPILLTTGPEAANGASCVMAIDGAPVDAEEVSTLKRVCILFDGTDPNAVQRARGQWKALTETGCSAQYWTEQSGRWEKKAEV